MAKIKKPPEMRAKCDNINSTIMSVIKEEIGIHKIKDVAKKLNISYSMFYAYSRNGINIPFSYVVLACDAMGLNLVDVIKKFQDSLNPGINNKLNNLI